MNTSSALVDQFVEPDPQPFRPGPVGRNLPTQSQQFVCSAALGGSGGPRREPKKDGRRGYAHSLHDGKQHPPCIESDAMRLICHRSDLRYPPSRPQGRASLAAETLVVSVRMHTLEPFNTRNLTSYSPLRDGSAIDTYIHTHSGWALIGEWCMVMSEFTTFILYALDVDHVTRDHSRGNFLSVAISCPSDDHSFITLVAVVAVTLCLPRSLKSNRLYRFPLVNTTASAPDHWG